MSSASIRAMTSWLHAERPHCSAWARPTLCERLSRRTGTGLADSMRSRAEASAGVTLPSWTITTSSGRRSCSWTVLRNARSDLTGVVAAIHRKQKGERNSHAGEEAAPGTRR